MTDIDRKSHPSGRPIRRQGIVRMGFARFPHDEPLTPGLHRKDAAYAIGFIARLSSQDADD